MSTPARRRSPRTIASWPIAACALAIAALCAPCPAFAEAAPRAEAASSDLWVGAHAVPIEVPPGAPLGGYAVRGPFHRSQGTRHPVEARAMVASDGRTTIGIVSLDVLIVTQPLHQAIAEQTELLPLDALTVVATHTHSGPGGYLQHPMPQWFVLGAYDPTVRAAVLDAAVAALEGATQNRRPARLATVKTSIPSLVKNRRREDGPADTTLRALLVDGESGAIATLFSFGAHPTILGPANRHFDPDYPGAARRTIDRARGGISLFVPGAAADQAPLAGRPTGTDEPNTQAAHSATFGETLATALLRATPRPTTSTTLASVDHDFTTPAIDVDEACTGWVGTPFYHLAARSFLSRTSPLLALRIGPLRLLASPYEVSADIDAELRLGLLEESREDSGDLLVVSSHANDWLGYLLSPEDYDRGGYEACLSVHGREAAAGFVAAGRRALESLP